MNTVDSSKNAHTEKDITMKRIQTSKPVRLLSFIYATVLEGAIRSSVNNGPVVTYHAGQSFSEMPGDRHSVSENASKTEPAKLLAVFVVDTDEKELTTSIEK